MLVIVSIHQPNFLPWLGYFNKIARSDKFIFLDNVGYTKGGVINRVKVLMQGEAKWLTLPIKKTQLNEPISSIYISSDEAKKKIFRSIEINYSRTPYYKEMITHVYDIVMNPSTDLSSYNIENIKYICRLLSLEVDFLNQVALGCTGKSTELIVELVKVVGGDVYLSGNGAKKYQTEEEFVHSGIVLEYQDFSPVAYVQRSSDSFVPGLSVIDALFNNGLDKTREMVICC